MKSNYYKFPRIYHFLYSPGLKNDDRMLPDDNIFVGKEIVVTSKLDGECTGMTNTTCHARSLDSRDHPSRHWVKSLHGKIKYKIPKNFHLFGENVFAKHSIFYDKLPSYFLVFGIFDENNNYLSWDDVVEYSKMLDLITVPVLYRGIWDIEKVKFCFTGKSQFGEEQEGYVVRTAGSFPLEKFNENTGKYVRKSHVKTSKFWMNKPIVPNRLIGST